MGDAAGTQQRSEIAEILVRTGAVSFRTDPFFTFTSGVASPVYVDNRQLLGHVAERKTVVDQFVQSPTLAGGSAEAVAGTATAGIAWAAWIADRLGVPMLYVRSQAKDWGKERAVEGTAPAGATVVVVEDLAFSGGSLLAAAKNLREEGFQVRDALSIVSYGTPAAIQSFEDADLQLRSLTTVDEALAAAERLGSLSKTQVDTVVDWLQEIRGQS